MPPLPTWFVLAIFIAAIPLAAISHRDTLKQRFKDTLDDDADGERAVDYCGWVDVDPADFPLPTPATRADPLGSRGAPAGHDSPIGGGDDFNLLHSQLNNSEG